jgi:hypothetical protein
MMINDRERVRERIDLLHHGLRRAVPELASRVKVPIITPGRGAGGERRRGRWRLNRPGWTVNGRPGITGRQRPEAEHREHNEATADPHLIGAELAFAAFTRGPDRRSGVEQLGHTPSGDAKDGSQVRLGQGTASQNHGRQP